MLKHRTKLGLAGWFDSSLTYITPRTLLHPVSWLAFGWLTLATLHWVKAHVCDANDASSARGTFHELAPPGLGVEGTSEASEVRASLAPSRVDDREQLTRRDRPARQPRATTDRVPHSRPETHRGDLPLIQERKVLRVLLRNNGASYFLWRGELLGFEYELAREFARQQGLHLEVVVPPSHEALLSWLREGRGDIAAGFLSPTDTQEAAFSRPFHHAPEFLVARTEDGSLHQIQDLAGRTVVVRRSSAYWRSVETLRAQGIPVQLVAAPEDMETEEILARVATGEFDLSIASQPELAITLTGREELQTVFALGDPVAHAWAVRRENPQLLAALNAFFQKEYRGVFYNLTYRRYFQNPGKIQAHAQHRIERQGTLSPYDGLIRRYADQYDFDWRLIVAQMYQESRFDPDAESWAGAQGLMQVMPRTAEQFGFDDLQDLENGIHAGVKYLDWTRQRFSGELSAADRLWFTLAAYNAGVGHMWDARGLARKLGRDPNRWFGHVEQAMLLLAQNEYASQARYGYVRGQEPVDYVRAIRERYNAYIRLTGSLVALNDH